MLGAVHIFGNRNWRPAPTTYRGTSDAGILRERTVRGNGFWWPNGCGTKVLGRSSPTPLACTGPPCAGAAASGTLNDSFMSEGAAGSSEMAEEKLPTRVQDFSEWYNQLVLKAQ